MLCISEALKDVYENQCQTTTQPGVKCLASDQVHGNLNALKTWPRNHKEWLSFSGPEISFAGVCPGQYHINQIMTRPMVVAILKTTPSLPDLAHDQTTCHASSESSTPGLAHTSLLFGVTSRNDKPKFFSQNFWQRRSVKMTSVNNYTDVSWLQTLCLFWGELVKELLVCGINENLYRTSRMCDQIYQDVYD